MNDVLEIPSQLDRIESKLDQLLATKKKRTPKKVEYCKAFEDVWRIYPKRQGSNPKKAAYYAWNNRLIEMGFNSSVSGLTPESSYASLYEATKSYAAYCNATGKTGTELVMQAKRFFGPNEEYLNDWTVNDVSSLLPKRDEDLIQFAVDNTLPPPGVGEGWKQYRAKLTQFLQARNQNG